MVTQKVLFILHLITNLISLAGSVSKEPTQRQLDFSDFAHNVASMESSSRKAEYGH